MSAETAVPLWTQIVYVGVLVWVCICLAIGHLGKKIDLWSAITTSKKLDDGTVKTIVDPKKLAYIGAFVIMAVTFAYWGLINRLSEWYATIFVAAFVLGKWLGDREQRLQQQKPQGGTQ